MNPLHSALAACLGLLCLGTPGQAQFLVGDGSVTCGEPYTVVAGDTLSRLSARAYGDPQLYGFIADANWTALRGNPESVAVGMSLQIPCVDATGKVLTPEEMAKAASSVGAVVAAEGPLSPEQLDTLFGPVALFPDPVLSPLLVAVTFPLDVVKAGRFVEASEALSDQERAEQAASKDWDESVRDLAAAFPDLVTRMNEHLDWTEQAGEAVLAQTDDVLDAIQRLRKTAQDNGYLVDNEAQVVETDGDTIIVMPADPGVVYVPVYDSQVVYTTPITSPPVYYYGDDYDGDWNDVIVGGGILLGAAIILDEIFDDDDDWDGWNDWNDDIDIDWDGGDITIDRGDINIGDGEINIGGGSRPDIGDGDRPGIGDGNRPGLGDGDRPGLGGGDRPAIGDGVRPGGGDRVSIGDLERPDIGSITRPSVERPAAGAVAAGGAAATIASQASRDAARLKIEKRQSAGGPVATLPARQPGARAAPSVRSTAGSRPVATTRAAPISKPAMSRQPTVRTPSRSSAFSRSSGARPSAASSRGRASAGARGGGRSGGGRR